MAARRLIIRNAKQLVTISTDAKQVHKVGKDMNELNIIENGTIVVDSEGNIEAVGPAGELAEKYKDPKFEVDIDATNKCVVPGLVDGHTHPVWDGDRVHEFAMKLAGATYMDIHKAGGGIGFTVEHTRKASDERLLSLLEGRLSRMLKAGTTLVEGKSGYGLELETEMRMLKVLHRANQKGPIEIVSNYCGAHSVPKGSTPVAAADDIVNNQIPALQKLKESNEISATLIDVFMENGVFGWEETERILRAGRKAGLQANFHGDELHPVKSAELASLKFEDGTPLALAVSHLECVSDDGVAALADNKIFATLLPTTAYILRLEPPPARKLIDRGVPVALGSDFNPNAHCLSMPLAMHLACVNLRMTMPEALTAATLNAAGSLGKGTTHGSLAVGKVGDMLLLDAPRWEHLVYQMVDPPIANVIKRGRIVVSN